MREGDEVYLTSKLRVVVAGKNLSKVVAVDRNDFDDEFTVSNAHLMLAGATPDPVVSPEHVAPDKSPWYGGTTPNPWQTTQGSPCWANTSDTSSQNRWTPAYFQQWLTGDSLKPGAMVVLCDGTPAELFAIDISFSPTSPSVTEEGVGDVKVAGPPA